MWLSYLNFCWCFLYSFNFKKIVSTSFQHSIFCPYEWWIFLCHYIYMYKHATWSFVQLCFLFLLFFVGLVFSRIYIEFLNKLRVMRVTKEMGESFSFCVENWCCLHEPISGLNKNIFILTVSFKNPHMQAYHFAHQCYLG